MLTVYLQFIGKINLNSKDSDPRVRCGEIGAVSTIKRALTAIRILLEKPVEGGGVEGGFQLIFNLKIPLHRLPTLLKQIPASRSREYPGYQLLGFSLRLPELANSVFELGTPCSMFALF